jgi:hypothetical protein
MTKFMQKKNIFKTAGNSSLLADLLFSRNVGRKCESYGLAASGMQSSSKMHTAHCNVMYSVL